MKKVDCYYYDEESNCCGALSDYSKTPCGLVPCTDDKCGMKEPRQTFECTGKNCPLEFGKGIGRCIATICEYRTKPTNFDKITSSVESLAEFIETISIKDISKERIVQWLLKESDDD